MSTETDAAAVLGQLANIVPGCNIGHPGELNETDTPPCESPADYYAEYHCCQPGKPGMGQGTISICAPHLESWVQYLQRTIHLTPPTVTPNCKYCRIPCPSIHDLVWNVQKIR